MGERILFAALLSINIIIFILGCGDSAKGEYVAPGIIVSLKSGGVAEVNGNTFPYEVKGKVITIKEGPGKEETLIIKDDGNLELNAFGQKITLKKR